MVARSLNDQWGFTMAEELVDALGDDLSGMSGVPRGLSVRPSLFKSRELDMPFKELLRNRSSNLAIGQVEKLQGNFQVLANALPSSFIGPGQGATVRLNPELAVESSRLIPFIGRLREAIKGNNPYLDGIKNLNQELERGLHGGILGKRRTLDWRKNLSRMRGLLTKFKPEDIGYIIDMGLNTQQKAPPLLVQDAYKTMAFILSGAAPPEAATMDMAKAGRSSEAALGRRAVDLGLETLRPDGRLGMGMRQPEGVMRTERALGTGQGANVGMMRSVGLESPRNSLTESIPAPTDTQLAPKPMAMGKRRRATGVLEKLRVVAEEDIGRASGAQKLLAKKTGAQSPFLADRLIDSFAQIISGHEPSSGRAPEGSQALARIRQVSAHEFSYENARTASHKIMKAMMERENVTEVTPAVLTELSQFFRRVMNKRIDDLDLSRGEREAMRSALETAENEAYGELKRKVKLPKTRAPSKLTESLLPDEIAEKRLLSREAKGLLKGVGRIPKGTVPMLAASAFAAGLMTLGLAGGGDEA